MKLYKVRFKPTERAEVMMVSKLIGSPLIPDAESRISAEEVVDMCIREHYHELLINAYDLAVSEVEWDATHKKD